MSFRTMNKHEGLQSALTDAFDTVEPCGGDHSRLQACLEQYAFLFTWGYFSDDPESMSECIELALALGADARGRPVHTAWCERLNMLIVVLGDPSEFIDELREFERKSRKDVSIVRDADAESA